MRTTTEKEIEQKAMIEASKEPMWNHADGCPYLISNQKKYCRCSHFTSINNRLRKEAGLNSV